MTCCFFSSLDDSVLFQHDANYFTFVQTAYEIEALLIPLYATLFQLVLVCSNNEICILGVFYEKPHNTSMEVIHFTFK